MQQKYLTRICELLNFHAAFYNKENLQFVEYGIRRICLQSLVKGPDTVFGASSPDKLL
jgi:hypothetical protein